MIYSVILLEAVGTRDGFLRNRESLKCFTILAVSIWISMVADNNEQSKQEDYAKDTHHMVLCFEIWQVANTKIF